MFLFSEFQTSKTLYDAKPCPARVLRKKLPPCSTKVPFTLTIRENKVSENSRWGGGCRGVLLWRTCSQCGYPFDFVPNSFPRPSWCAFFQFPYGREEHFAVGVSVDSGPEILGHYGSRDCPARKF